jgi:SAM-dependent methyltransferase
VDIDPAAYEAWYHTPRGAWIGDVEFSLLMRLLQPQTGQSLLDVGSGTGYFSRRFAGAGLHVTGVDPQPDMIRYARTQNDNVEYIDGTAQRLPFENESFDFCIAVTSFCFVSEPEQALAEMWRVSRHGVILGLLNRHSLLYRMKHGSGSYKDARWDTIASARHWFRHLILAPNVTSRTAVWLPGGGRLARIMESLLPGNLPWGGFLAIGLLKP